MGQGGEGPMGGSEHIQEDWLQRIKADEAQLPDTAQDPLSSCRL